MAYLNLLLSRPAVPELEGMKPYEEMILAFALQGEHETATDSMPPTCLQRDDMAAGGCFVWDCFENHSLWREAIDLLIEKLSHYEVIVCFTPQNLTTTLLRHEIIQNQTIGYKILNLFDVLLKANFYHPSIKRGLTLQGVAESLFCDVKLFEHSRILLEATSNDLMGYQQAREDLITENEVVAKTYQLLFK